MVTLLKRALYSILSTVTLATNLAKTLFHNALQFLERAAQALSDTYLAIVDYLRKLAKSTLSLGIALAQLSLLFAPTFIGLALYKFYSPSPWLYWTSIGYAGFITMVGFFYSPSGISLAGQIDPAMARFFSPRLISDEHYSRYLKELIEQWKQLQDSAQREQKGVMRDNLKSVINQCELAIASCKDYCERGVGIRRLLARKNMPGLVEERRERLLAAAATKDAATRANYNAIVARIDDSLRQASFFRRCLERIDSYVLKVAATIGGIHSNVLEIGLTGDLQRLDGDLFKDLEREAIAIDCVLQEMDAGRSAEEVRPIEEVIAEASLEVVRATYEDVEGSTASPDPSNGDDPPAARVQETADTSLNIVSAPAGGLKVDSAEALYIDREQPREAGTGSTPGGGADDDVKSA